MNNRFTILIGWLSIIIIAIILALFMSGCSTTTKLQTKSEVLTDSVAVEKYDSVWGSSISDVNTGVIERETIYRDTVIYRNGEPVFLPASTIERHYYHNELIRVDTGRIVYVDSSSSHVVIKEQAASKESKPFFFSMKWIGIAAGLLLLLIVVSIIAIKVAVRRGKQIKAAKTVLSI